MREQRRLRIGDLLVSDRASRCLEATITNAFLCPFGRPLASVGREINAGVSPEMRREKKCITQSRRETKKVLSILF